MRFAVVFSAATGIQAVEGLLLGKIRRRQQSLRTPAAIIAAFYLFLCIFGPLTHSHLLQIGNGIPASALSQGQATAVHASEGQRCFSLSAHCAYCEWEANCLSP